MAMLALLLAGKIPTPAAEGKLTSAMWIFRGMGYVVLVVR
jgi:hypothetical protein